MVAEQSDTLRLESVDSLAVAQHDMSQAESVDSTVVGQNDDMLAAAGIDAVAPARFDTQHLKVVLEDLQVESADSTVAVHCDRQYWGTVADGW